MRIRPLRIATHALLVLTATGMILPFLWMAVTSLKTSKEVAAYPTQWLPSSWQLGNYASAMQAAPFDLYFRNSIIIAMGHVVV
ncbi:ABC transporter permease family protein [Fodinicola feengrottensis]|nr:hypothetical protein [Fodinicola feengrottensis]